MAKSLYDFCIEKDEFELLVQWDKQKNGELTPRDVSHGSHKKIWWQCAEGHIWKAVVYSRTGPDKCGCPVCAGNINKKRLEMYADIIESKTR